MRFWEKATNGKFRFLSIRNIVFFLIVALSVAMHVGVFTKDLISIHVWRQTQTQSTINSFYEEDMNILNPHQNERGKGEGILRMEFPLMQWMVACLYQIFGNHLLISRLFMFVVGLFSVAGLYKLLKVLFRNETLALMGAWAFNFSPSFYYYTVNPLPDNFALCCAIWGMVCFFTWYRNHDHHNKTLWLSGFLLSVGTLCKLPFVLYYAVPFTYFLMVALKQGLNKQLVLNTARVFMFVVLPMAWYVSVIPQWKGNGIVTGMLQNSGTFSSYFDYLQHNLISTLPELLLNYGSVLFFVCGFYFIGKNKVYQHNLFPLFVVWSLAVAGYVLFELNMIVKIHDYYLFPFYPILFILVAYGAYQLLLQPNKFAQYAVIFLLAILPLTAYLRINPRWNSPDPGFNKDLLHYKTELQQAVPKHALCIVGNDASHFISFYYIDKKGWGFENNTLNADSVKQMIRNGAQYLYSDSRQIDSTESMAPYIDSLVLQKGSIKVFRLKH